ncbi:hypothetical protein E2C01_035248 [Portunus trituberculatus]|uniref:Uncharacterized protein n=1 Tax=Portunus trituberculatus TaxID=210409 RepID=A0A5B7F7Z4_PORTR|nr:hypothetical protein [Portunus trituberculatus]
MSTGNLCYYPAKIRSFIEVRAKSLDNVLSRAGKAVGAAVIDYGHTTTDFPARKLRGHKPSDPGSVVLPELVFAMGNVWQPPRTQSIWAHERPQ